VSFLRNSLFNFAGALVPAAAALLTVPAIVSHLGAAHYGVFVLVTSVIGYFAVLDINATAGSVKYVAEHHARGENESIGEVLAFGGGLYAAIGLLGGLAIFFSAESLVQSVFNIPPPLQAEALNALRWAGVAFLAGQLQVYLQSVPDALQRYDVAAKFEAVFGTLAPAATVVVVLLGGSLVEIIIARLALSLINIALLLYAIRALLPRVRLRRPARERVRAITSFSIFSYLSRLAAISAANADKLLVGAIVDMKALSFYAVPFALANRVFGLVYRFAEVLFPHASALHAQRRHEDLRRTYLVATRYIVYLNASLCTLLVAMAPELLHYWAGAVFGQPAVWVMVFIAFSVLVDSLTNLPSLFNDGLGRPKITGVAAIARTFASLGAAWWAVSHYGIVGAATAQFCVSVVSTVVFLIVVHRVSVPVLLRDVVVAGFSPSLPVIVVAVALGSWSLVRPVLPLVEFFAAGAAMTLALMGYAWWRVVEAPDRMRLLAAARGRLSAGGGV
jgi:O-antigen/teichoic acid export membrane protein